MLDTTNGQTKKIKNLSHPNRITLGKVVVHRHKVTPLATQRIGVERQCRGECLSFTGAHLRDLSAMKHKSSDKLHIEMSLTKRATPSFADNRKRLVHKIVDYFSCGESILEFSRLCLELFIAQSEQPAFKCVNFFYLLPKLRQEFLVWITKEDLQNL